MDIVLHSKVIRIGNSVGMVLPKEIASGLDLKPGDAVQIASDKNGVVLSKSSKKAARKERQTTKKSE